MRAWRLLDDSEDARSTLEAALATTTDSHELWLARLYVAGQDRGEALQVVARWKAAMPRQVPPLEAHLSLLQAQVRRLPPTRWRARSCSSSPAG